MMEQTRERVVSQLVSDHFPEASATELVEQAWVQGREERRREGRAEIARGVGGILLGIVLSLLISTALQGIFFFVFVWGPILYGIGSVIWGARKLLS